MTNESSKTVEGESGSLVATEDVWPQMPARDLVVSDVLDSRPVDRIEESALGQPPRNELLANSLRLWSVATQKLRQTIRKRRLAAGNSDRSTKRENVLGLNVVRLHDHKLYKQACNKVNKSARMTPNKATCTVIDMTVVGRKPTASSSKTKRKQPFRLGADGRTANDRFREAFNSWRAGDRLKSETDLVRICNVIAGLRADAEKPYVSQQMINQMINDEIDAARSSFLDVLAEGLDVRIVWLRLGVGAKQSDRSMLAQMREILNKS